MSKPNRAAVAAVREFRAAVLGDIRELHRELRNAPDGQIAIEETARFLAELSQELLAGSTPQPEQPGVPLSDMMQQQQPEQAPQPQDEQSPAAEMLSKLGV